MPSGSALLLIAIVAVAGVSGVLALNQFHVIGTSKASVASPAGFTNIVTILMENEAFCSVYTGCGGTGTFQSNLANQNTLVTTWGTINHNSEPNYIALFGAINDGSTSGDGVCCYFETGQNIVDRLETAGLSWTAWAESAGNSGTCSFSPPRNGDHFPFKDFADMNTASRCSHFITTTAPSSPGVQGADPEFISSLTTTAPSFIWLTPTDTDNGHDSGVSGGDAYLAELVPRILASPLFTSTTKNPTLLIVYDEGYSQCSNTGGTGECVYASFSGPAALKGLQLGPNGASHYSFLSTLEANWNLPAINANDQTAPNFMGAFGSNPPPPTTCTNGAINPPTCNQCPAGQTLLGGVCVTTTPPPGNSTLGKFNQTISGYSWAPNTLSPSLAAITGGSFQETQNNPPPNCDYVGSYYDTAQIGNFPWGPGAAAGGPTPQPTPPPGAPGLPLPSGNISIALTFASYTPAASCTSPSGNGPHYNIYIGLYYWFPNGALTLTAPPGCGCSPVNPGQTITKQWADTQNRISEVDAGSQVSVGTTSTYFPGDSFGYSIVLNTLTPGHTLTVVNFDIQKQFIAMAQAWGVPPGTQFQLLGIELGSEGYDFTNLSVTWSGVTVSPGGNGITAGPPPCYNAFFCSGLKIPITLGILITVAAVAVVIVVKRRR